MAIRRALTFSVMTETTTGSSLGWVRAFSTPEWMARAACVGYDPETWFAMAGPGRRSQARRASASEPAKAVCAECPVRTECLEYALEAGQQHGVWGGLDEHERRELKARHPRGA